MRKLILKCGLSPGDIVMLTAAVRDLHHYYPGQFATDVRTVCPGLWENNPYLTTLSEDEPGAEQIDCSYPLIDRCNESPYHCLHGFAEFLNDRLDLSIKPTVFKGDIHLSGQEKAWYSQVHEVTGEDTPFWIVAAGGKYDLTIKWWQAERYQEVVNHFRGKIQFVQVGDVGHHHPKLEGVIDLRGQTDLRELVRLVYHSQGVLCSVTALMHLAAAVETKPGQPANRPCVVVAGGREPAHWEAYPDHQFIHTNGALRCCVSGGCWKDRTARLRDGDERDGRDHLCVDVINGLPRCMDLITAAEVIRRIELYFRGGVIRSLSPRQRAFAERGIIATAKNSYDRQPLNLQSAGGACERFIRTIPSYPDRYQGRGIVICGGGVRYFTGAWVCISMLRRLGCRLPIQLWYLGRKELDSQMERLVAPLGVECVDASKVRREFPARILGGWALKPYAIVQSPFREVLLLDADNVPVVDPEYLFDTPQFKSSGAIFWPDYPAWQSSRARAIWRSCGLRLPNEPEFESGQIAVDKRRCWGALCLSIWFNENSDFFYQHLHGDKETFHLAFRKLKKSYALVPKPIHPLEGTMCQHDFEGRRIFQHRNMDKWDLFLRNKRVDDFWFEKDCRADVVQLRGRWHGGIGQGVKGWTGAIVPAKLRGQPLKIVAVIISGLERNETRRQTLDNLARTDWDGAPLLVQIDDVDAENHQQWETERAYRALEKGLAHGADYILLLTDDLDFNRHLGHNLHNWGPLRAGAVTLASLFNPKVRESACDLRNNARIVDPNEVFGGQAFLIATDTARYVVRHWEEVEGGQDIRISRLAGRQRKPIFYHAPSLVQRIRTAGASEPGFREAMDFDPIWKA
jgi:ADP-heptose:LPS heptosyltransferase